MKIFTIGHSNRPFFELVDCLLAYGIEALADVRSYPRSKRNFQFNQDVLVSELPKIGVEYIWMGPGLGGFRKNMQGPSQNDAWSSKGFQNFADYTDTPGFKMAISELMEIAAKKITTIMCAEMDYTECHRQIIADHLLVRGIEVIHIIDPHRFKPHVLTPFARLEKDSITYPRRWRNSVLNEFESGSADGQKTKDNGYF